MCKYVTEALSCLLGRDFVVWNKLGVDVRLGHRCSLQVYFR